MLSIHSFVSGRECCGTLHIRNTSDHPEHPEKGYYEAVSYDRYGRPEWHVERVEHIRSEPWFVLLTKCVEARANAEDFEGWGVKAVKK